MFGGGKGGHVFPVVRRWLCGWVLGGGVGGLYGGGRGLRVKQLFQGSFANVGGIFREGGGLGARLSLHGVLILSGYFLIS